MTRAFARLIFLIALSALLSAPSANAQEGPAHAGLSLELNRLEQNGPACRATFVATNGFDENLKETAFEVVTFDRRGLIDLMTVIDFGALPEGKTMVRRFDLPQTVCGEMSRILVNSVSRCAGETVDIARCRASFTTENHAEIKFGL
ncbi:hypothetical protein [Pseudohoeflea coraliihabitans]|uniref:Tat pathway signal sequence domain protein n=1 Tax=Pseudohoeflea coraliihabitans TaxID=2860393 RepID=A0ABS6WP17_9HYPH|nr:hypothetical protein [Pseudohoeflea sp. DP4N28-3]MBW3097712.1 hypothetical protein [Pseudohoeflea sp. DP4N28-3]